MNATKPVNKIVSGNTSFLKNTFNLEVTKINNNKLPNIQWTTKFHIWIVIYYLKFLMVQYVQKSYVFMGQKQI